MSKFTRCLSTGSVLQRQMLPMLVQKKKKKVQKHSNNIVPCSVVLGTEGSIVWESDRDTRSVTPHLVFITCPRSGTSSVVTSTVSHTRASSTSGRQSSTRVSGLNLSQPLSLLFFKFPFSRQHFVTASLSENSEPL